MMKTIKDKLQLALEALITINNAIYVNSQQEAAAVYKANEAITALKEALTSVPDWASEVIEQPSGGATLAPVAKPHEQEPVAWRYKDARGHYRYRGFVKNFDKEYSILNPQALYTSPPTLSLAQRKPLTDEEIDKIYETNVWDPKRSFARAIEAAHGITAAPQLKEST